MSVFTADPIGVVNTTTLGDQFKPSVAALADGGYVVAWTSGTGASSAVYAQKYDANGSKVGAETLLFQEPSAFGVKAGGVVGLPDGGYVVSFSNGRQERTFVYDNTWAVHVNPDGSVQGGAAFVVDVSLSVASGGEQTTTAGDVYAAPDGGFYVAMQRMFRPTPVSTWSTDLQRYDASGNPMGTPFHVAGGFPNASITVLPDGNIAAAWDVWGGPTQPHVEWNVLSPDGQVIAQGTVHESAFARDVNPSITALQDGHWLLVWSHEPDTVLAPANPTPAGVYASILDEAGHALAAPSLLAVPQTPDIVALPGGGFLAWWAQDTGDGHDAFFAREFSASGQALGDPFPIAAPATTQTGTLFKALPDVTVLANGGFVVAFEGAGTGEDVYQQAFHVATGTGGGSTIDGSTGRDDLHGTAAADTLHGFNGKDTLSGGLGDDLLDGGNGVDTALFTGNRSQYVVSATAAGWTIAGPDGRDTLVGVERLQFADAKLALDVNGDAGMAWRLYQAAFDRAPDLSGLGYQMNALDDGLSLHDVATHFLESPEFQAKYGALDAEQFVQQLYRNVLHREAESAGLAYHLARLASGVTRADILAGFSESPENQVAVIGSIENGMLYA